MNATFINAAQKSSLAYTGEGWGEVKNPANLLIP
jgi:hypothetical protein